MQGHYNIYFPDEEQLDQTITKFKELVKHSESNMGLYNQFIPQISREESWETRHFHTAFPGVRSLLAEFLVWNRLSIDLHFVK